MAAQLLLRLPLRLLLRQLLATIAAATGLLLLLPLLLLLTVDMADVDLHGRLVLRLDQAVGGGAAANCKEGCRVRVVQPEVGDRQLSVVEQD